MFSKEDIEFEGVLFLKGSMVSQYEIIDAVYNHTLKAIADMKIKTLKKVVIKEMNLFETTLGLARMNCNESKVELAYVTAVNLCDRLNERKGKYNEVLATFYHEFYHIVDYENVFRKLVTTISEEQRKDWDMGYDLWTEFYATYSTYKYNEQVALYDSFEQVFNNEQMNDDKKMYYTSRILGYYLSEGHSSRCDKLVEKFLRRDKMLKAVGCAKRMFEEHPCISVDEVITYGKLIKESCTYSGSVRDFRPLSHDELWELFKRK